MTRNPTTAYAAAWQSRPLCCRYLLVSFGAQLMLVRADDAAFNFSATWALGELDDGQREVLGVWPAPIAEAPNWQEVFDDLAVRGVERIRFVVNADEKTVRAAQPSATVLSLGTPSSPSLAPSAALSPRLRRIVKSADDAAQQMQAALTHVVRRHGTFDSPGSALMALEQALQRLEQRLWVRPAISQVAALRQLAVAVPAPAI